MLWSNHGIERVEHTPDTGGGRAEEVRWLMLDDLEEEARPELPIDLVKEWILVQEELTDNPRGSQKLVRVVRIDRPVKVIDSSEEKFRSIHGYRSSAKRRLT
jgi:hypothetical protein